VAARILQRYSFTRSLYDKDWNALVRELLDAVCFARVGLSGLLGGKQAKPAAWTQDIFVKDVFDALATAQPRRRLSMNRYGSRSLVQRLAGELAVAAGVPVKGELFKQMQRARQIEKAGGYVQYGRRPRLIIGQWQSGD